jgi:hypothetical protein
MVSTGRTRVRGYGRAVALALLVSVCGILGTRALGLPPYPGLHLLRLCRHAARTVSAAVHRRLILRRTSSWLSAGEGRLQVIYTAPDADIVPVIASYAERAWDAVARELGFSGAAVPTLILSPSFRELGHCFGEGAAASSVGMYRAGVVGMVSPRAWGGVFGRDEATDPFELYNPLHHEFCHYVLEEMTDGNCPSWFSEGVAQLMERRATGYACYDARTAGGASVLAAAPALVDLDRALYSEDGMPAAYLKSLWAAERLMSVLGRDGFGRLTGLLREGIAFDDALREVAGASCSELDREWGEWVRGALRGREGTGAKTVEQTSGGSGTLGS